MLEVEIKILEINPPEITNKILQLGGILVTPQRLVAAQKFDTPAHDIKNKNDLLRLRKNGDQVEIVYKINRTHDSGFRRAEEIETTVGDFETMQQILLTLGFVTTEYQEKKRTTFSLFDTLIEIDEYPTIPAYIEIEGEEKNIQKVVQELGFAWAHTSTLSASQVLKHYGVDTTLQKF